MAADLPLPDFDDLPKVDGMPQGCAWGIFDRAGKKDLLGTLNLLTPAVIAAAAAEVKDGVSISLNWPLNAIKSPMPGRGKPVHKHIALSSSGIAPAGCHAWDDELAFNTQVSSQWDSLAHWQHQASGLGYNGAQVTKEALQTTDTDGDDLPTLEHWHTRGGLVGRGVLIDFKGYMESQGRSFSCLDGYRITVEEVEAAARHQGVEFRVGDVLIIRTGTTEMFESMSPVDLTNMQYRDSGLHGSEETARWVWNRHFSAVAADNASFEAFPPLRPDGKEGDAGDVDDFEPELCRISLASHMADGLVLHQWFLAMFGLPIGELWDLKELAAYCKKKGRYSFMLTSAPLNHAGLVASPPNVLAIF